MKFILKLLMCSIFLTLVYVPTVKAESVEIVELPRPFRYLVKTNDVEKFVELKLALLVNAGTAGNFKFYIPFIESALLSSVANITINDLSHFDLIKLKLTDKLKSDWEDMFGSDSEIKDFKSVVIYSLIYQ